MDLSWIHFLGNGIKWIPIRIPILFVFSSRYPYFIPGIQLEQTIPKRIYQPVDLLDLYSFDGIYKKNHSKSLYTFKAVLWSSFATSESTGENFDCIQKIHGS